MTVPPPAPPVGTLVLRRAAAMEKRVSSALVVQIVLLSAGIVACCAAGVAIAVVTARAAVPFYRLVFSFAGLVPTLGTCAYSLRAAVRRRRAERGLRGMELWLWPGGVAYLGAGAYYPAPWAAVRGIRFEGRRRRRHRAEALRMDVDGWGGPLAAYAAAGRPCSLRMPLAGLGIEHATIARAAREMTRGAVTIA